MSFPQPELRYDEHYSAAPSMPMAGPGMPTAVPYDHQSTYPIAYSQPSSTSYTPSYTTYAGDNGYLAPPPMGPHPSAHAGTYDYSRPSTPYSQMTTTAVGSDHSHDVGFTPQPRAQSAATQATTSGTKPSTGPPTGTSGKPSDKPKTKGRGQPGDSHGSGCCIIM